MPSTQDQVALPAAPKLSLAARYRCDGEIGESPLRSRSPKANKPSISTKPSLLPKQEPPPAKPSKSLLRGQQPPPAKPPKPLLRTGDSIV